MDESFPPTAKDKPEEKKESFPQTQQQQKGEGSGNLSKSTANASDKHDKYGNKAE